MGNKIDVRVVFCGGTIAANVIEGQECLTRDIWDEVQIKALISAAQETSISHQFNVTSITTPFVLFSEELTPQHWIKIIEAIRTTEKKATQSTLIIHGTDTMIHSATAIDFLLNKPFVAKNMTETVVCTGANIPLGEPESDAANNVAGALSFLGTKTAGTFISFSGKQIGESTIVIPSRSQKTFDGQTNIFTMPNSAPVGHSDAFGGTTLDHYWKTELREAQNCDPLNPNTSIGGFADLQGTAATLFSKWQQRNNVEKAKSLGDVEPLVVVSDPTTKYVELQNILDQRLSNGKHVFVTIVSLPSGTFPDQHENKFASLVNWCHNNHVPVMMTLPDPNPAASPPRYPATQDTLHKISFFPTALPQTLTIKGICVAAATQPINTKKGNKMFTEVMKIPFRQEFSMMQKTSQNTPKQ